MGSPLQVTVGIKEYMHHEAYTGMTADGVFAGEPHELFVGSVPDAEDAPPFQLKAVDEDTLVKIQQRYDCVHPRLEALYPDGESLCLWNGSLCLRSFIQRLFCAPLPRDRPPPFDLPPSPR